MLHHMRLEASNLIAHRLAEDKVRFLIPAPPGDGRGNPILINIARVELVHHPARRIMDGRTNHDLHASRQIRFNTAHHIIHICLIKHTL